jgi:hypothetical protein
MDDYRAEEGGPKMKRLGSASLFACAIVVLSASTALASSTYPPSQSVEATSGSSPPGGIGGTTAFTGSDVSRLVLVAAVLLVVGLATLAIVRRRARAVG